MSFSRNHFAFSHYEMGSPVGTNHSILTFVTLNIFGMNKQSSTASSWHRERTGSARPRPCVRFPSFPRVLRPSSPAETRFARRRDWRGIACLSLVVCQQGGLFPACHPGCTRWYKSKVTLAHAWTRVPRGGGSQFPKLTSIVAVPSAASVNGGLYPSTTSGNGLLVGYASPSPLGRADKHKACWCVSMPPFARMRPVLCLLARSSRAMAVMAFAMSIQCGWPARTRATETYVHRVVVSGASKRGQAP